MNIFINEKSIPANEDEYLAMIDTFTESFEIFCHTIQQIGKKYTLYYRSSAMENGLSYLETEVEIRSTFNLIAFDYLEEYDGNLDAMFYYHYFTHQHFVLDISENISHTSLAIAAEKVLQNQLAVMLNLPNSPYNIRPYLPILQSPYNAKEQDKLANIPCFDNAKKAKSFVFLHEKIRQQVTQDFETFAKEYQTYIDSFDFTNWKPKQMKDNKLIENIAFPASSNVSIKKELDKWKIKKGSIENNIREYNRLGGIVAELHGYTKNEGLSSHYKKYDIYEAGYDNNKLLLSIDVENGAFEVIESSGTHIGVYGYDGHYIKHYTKQTDIDNHSFKNIPTHLFLFKQR